jgi:hypothetical protein
VMANRPRSMKRILDGTPASHRSSAQPRPLRRPRSDQFTVANFPHALRIQLHRGPARSPRPKPTEIISAQLARDIDYFADEIKAGSLRLSMVLAESSSVSTPAVLPLSHSLRCRQVQFPSGGFAAPGRPAPGWSIHRAHATQPAVGQPDGKHSAKGRARAALRPRPWVVFHRASVTSRPGARSITTGTRFPVRRDL